MSYIKNNPFVGHESAEKIYKLLEKYKPLQVSVCGIVTSFVCYKKDSDLFRMFISRMFPEMRIKEIECIYTGYITVYTLPK